MATDGSHKKFTGFDTGRTGYADENIQQVFSDLAYDLNFYEDEPRDRDEALGYYGDDKLVEVVDAAIKKIEEYE